MSASALKRMWPILIVPEVREWVIERIERGSLQRIEIGVNSPVETCRAAARRSLMTVLRSTSSPTGVTLRPVDDLPRFAMPI